MSTLGIKSRERGYTCYKTPREDFCMGKGNKIKKEKVPKITEEEYTAYLTALKLGEEEGSKTPVLLKGGAGKNK